MILKELLLEGLTEQKLSELDFIINFGPGRCGKGTAALALQELCRPTFPIEIITTSKLIEQHIADNTDLAPDFREFKKIIRSGGLAPDEPILKAFAREVTRLVKEGRQVFILDGVPRTIQQAYEVEETDIPFVFHDYDLTLEDGLKRGDLARNDPDRKDRLDDDDAVYRGRYKVFTLETLPVRDYYKAKYPERYLRIDVNLPLVEKMKIVLNKVPLSYAALEEALAKIEPVCREVLKRKGQLTDKIVPMAA